jgi:hypothetical protein
MLRDAGLLGANTAAADAKAAADANNPIKKAIG